MAVPECAGRRRAAGGRAPRTDRDPLLRVGEPPGRQHARLAPHFLNPTTVPGSTPPLLAVKHAETTRSP
ncbi:hypothetical protein SGPA1_40124 [Streptomyces misionensis JCM 4497]